MLTMPTQLGAIKGSAIIPPFQATQICDCVSYDLSHNSTPYYF